MTAHPNFPNGRMPASQLSVVQTGVFAGRAYAIALYTPAANAWIREKNNIITTRGIIPLIAPPDGGYRDLFTQADMRAQSLGQPHQLDHGLNPNSTARLAPAGQSTHGWGTAVDVLPQAAVNLLKAAGASLARQFGFSFPIADDPNHSEQNLVTATSSLGTSPLPGGGTSASRALEEDEDEMYYQHPNGTIVALSSAGGFYRSLSSQETLAVQARAAVDPSILFHVASDAAWTETFGPLTGVSRWVPQSFTLPQQVDQAGVAAAVTAALKTASIDVDPTIIANAVRTAMQPDFAAIPAAVVKAEGAALSNG
jgi:hypothetical protein